MDARQAYIVMNMMQGIGPVTVRKLMDALGSVEAVLQADGDVLRRVPGVGNEMTARILEQRERLDPQAEEEKAAGSGVRIVTRVDAEYPKRLLQIYDPPLALYVKGTLQSRDECGIALVGSRRTSHYGLETSERLAFLLAQNGVTVISGLARGIDTAAHRGALKGRGRTLAVLGGAMDCLFPAENAGLAEEIAQSGAVMTEYPFGRQPDKTTFPVRNRIVSGISQGVVVVEADATSGAMITANQAMEQGRTVFAVPGRVDAAGSRGPHRLIKQGARLVETVDDILEELQTLLPMPTATPKEAVRKVSLTEAEQDILRLLEVDGEADVDTLIRKSGRRAADISALVMGLEIKRMVKMLPGQRVGLRRQ